MHGLVLPAVTHHHVGTSLGHTLNEHLRCRTKVSLVCLVSKAGNKIGQAVEALLYDLAWRGVFDARGRGPRSL